MNNYYIKNGKLVIEIPLTVKRNNPYDDEEQEEMDNIIGIICGNEYGFANLIDMSYCGKADQWTNNFYNYFGSEKDFIFLCKKLGIDYYKYQTCSNCLKPILGAFTYKNGGEVCMECAEED